MKVNEVITEGWRDYIPKFVSATDLEAEKKRKKQEKYVYQQSARFGEVAYKELEKELAKLNVRLNDPRTYNALQGYNLSDFLRAFAMKFFGSDWNTGNLVKNDISKMPVPTQLNPGSIKQYLNDANEKYRAVLDNQLSVQLRQDAEKQQETQKAINDLAYNVFIKKVDINDVPKSIQQQVLQLVNNPPAAWGTAPAQQVQQPQQPQQQNPQLAPGVSVVSTSPVILRYGKRDYYIADDGMWHERNNRNPVDDTWQRFFDQQAELVEPQFQVSQSAQPATPVVKPRIKVRPGETPAQAVARAKARK